MVEDACENLSDFQMKLTGLVTELARGKLCK